MENLNVVRLARIALIIVALALSLGVGAKTVQAQTLFGLAHSGPDGLSTLYRINPATGAYDPVGKGTGFRRCSGMDFDASGTLFATCESAIDNTHVLITIDPSTGEGTGAEVGPTGVGSETPFLILFKTVSDISFRPLDDVLYAYLEQLDFLGTIDVASGEATLIMPPFGIGNTGVGNGIAFSPENDLFNANEKTLNTLDLATGLATLVAYLVFPGLPSSPDLCCENIPRANALDFQPGTGILFASVNDRLLQSPVVGKRPHKNFLATIDTTTGEVIIKGKTVKGLDAIAFAPAATSTTSVEAELGSFKCYGVKRPKGSPKLGKTKVELNDRFDGTKDTRVEKAESVCTPVPDDATSTAGFTCYKIKDVKGQPKFQKLDVLVENDLYGEGQALTLKKAETICVPSTVTEVTR